MSCVLIFALHLLAFSMRRFFVEELPQEFCSSFLSAPMYTVYDNDLLEMVGRLEIKDRLEGCSFVFENSEKPLVRGNLRNCFLAISPKLEDFDLPDYLVELLEEQMLKVS